MNDVRLAYCLITVDCYCERSGQPVMDLRNAFGEVPNNLIRAAIKYHHLRDFITDIFYSIYRDSAIYVAVNKGWTSQLNVKRGVPQRDPLSTLLFNLFSQHVSRYC